ncbi:glucose dehydrogenase [FAD, quinone]-like isoform X2 [Bradysia coprophila]|nr:glucose dehydrogenase [FAD, quinone]-like isoform X2 [Bradysia coprophila]
MLTQPEVQWNFQTVPQKHACLAMNNQACNWHRGIGLGGSSNLNYMMYARGHPEDYNNWAKITGDNRWRYENVLPYFKKSENFECQDELDEETSVYHAKNGPLTVRYADYKGLADYVLKAAKEYGFPEIDYNAQFPQGFAVIQNTFQSNGFRMGTNQAFLNPIRGTRENLTIHKFSLAHKVLFEEGTKKVIGVEYSRHGKTKVAYAKKEVVISAGAINSPKILMQSGIGPKKHLQSLNIDVKLDLPGVGQNLQDHIGAFVGPFVMNDTVSYHPDRDLTLSMFLNFWLRGKGVLNTVGSDASGFISSQRAVQLGEKHWPDIQHITTNYAASDTLIKNFEKAFNYKPNVLPKYYEKARGKDSFHVLSILNRPVTRGEILLKSADPTEHPLIDPKYYDDESDLKTFAESIKFIVNFIENSKTFQAFDARLLETPFPGCEKHAIKSDAYYECYARQFTQSIWHYSGTCAMGATGDKDAVLNSELQVIGVENLRVMDASVMPEVVSANTNAACIMIGELGADLIKEKHGNKNDEKDSDMPDREEL